MKNINTYLMRSLLFVFLLTFTLCSTMNKPKRVIFFGDSITELGAVDRGYIKLLGEMLVEEGFSGQFDLIGAGLSGNKIPDLQQRLQKDVISKEPDLVIIYIGINDVWQKSVGSGTDEDEFAKVYKSLISKIEETGAEVVLCTPTVIGERKANANEFDADLNHYAEIVRQLAADHHTGLVDLRNIFVRYNLKHNSKNQDMGILTNDGVHLNKKGNQVVADAMLNQLLINK